MRIYLAGRVAIEHAGALVDQNAFGGRQAVLTFARLLAPPHAAVSRQALAAALWDETPPRAWDTALHAIVSKLRGVLARAGLPKADAVRSALGCYQIGLPTDAWVDLQAAAEALHAAEGALKAARPRDAWSHAQVAYHVLKRPFLAGESGGWATQMRERLAGGQARACECLAEAYAWNGEPDLAVDLARQAVAAQPFRESSHRALMRAHLGAGNRAEALLAYERCRALISEALGVSPGADTEALYLEVLRAR